MATRQRLRVYLDGIPIGDAEQTGGSLSFTYDEEYRSEPNATPLSLSMPLAAPRHGNRAVRAFLDGLLPDSQPARERWAREYGVSANNPFGLLANVGRDAQPRSEQACHHGLATGGVRQFARDGREGRLRRHLTVEQFMRLLHHDHQRTRLTLPVRPEFIGLLLPRRADLARQQIRHEQIIQVAFMFAIRKHHMLTILQRVDDILHAVRGGFLDDIRLAKQAPQFIVQSLRRHHVHAVAVRPRRHTIGMRHALHLSLFVLHFHLFAVHRLEAREPLILERPKQRVQRGGRGLFQIQFTAQRFDIGCGNVAC